MRPEPFRVDVVDVTQEMVVYEISCLSETRIELVELRLLASVAAELEIGRLDLKTDPSGAPQQYRVSFAEGQAPVDALAVFSGLALESYGLR